jgi:transposase
MKPISEQTYNNIVSLLDHNLSLRQIATQLGISKTTVSKVRDEARPDKEKSKGGRPAKIATVDKRQLARLAALKKINTTRKLAQELKNASNIDVSAETVRRTLKKSGMKAVTRKKKPKLQPNHIRQRYDFALRHQYWTTEDWRRVIWSDETKINRLGSDGRQWIWKKTGDNRLTEQDIQGTVKFGGGSIMMWGCMTAKGVGFACRIDGNMDAEVYVNILDEYLLQTIKYYKLDRNHIIFQQDNDPKHTSRIARNWLDDHSIEVLEWPPQSPDLSPIEHLFQHLKNKLADYKTEPNGILELWERAEVEWDQITADICVNLIDSMPRRIAAVIKAKGGYTKY